MSIGATAGLFPGQGSQTSDLRDRVERTVPELLDRCIELVGEDPFARVADSTRFAQPAIYCASIAGWIEWRSLVRPTAFAGHSLGELSALVAAEALDPMSGLELAVVRGELMASVRTREEQGMLAVLGAQEQLPGLLAEQHGLVLANDNAPGQVVLAGPVDRLRDAAAHTRASGARAIWLDVAGAFHSPAMAEAVGPYRQALERVAFRPPEATVLSSSTARPFADVRAELADAIVKPVRWRETMLALAAEGADTFVDFGPGAVLARLVLRNLPAANVLDPSRLPSSTGRESSGVL
ncbi:MAG TPA: ACP S-malonyltransferase [Solirubrobacteraceae bacterium]|nr:ACP S-malonyltransferase [Solirubrobacteraceae bacterium]